MRTKLIILSVAVSILSACNSGQIAVNSTDPLVATTSSSTESESSSSSPASTSSPSIPPSRTIEDDGVDMKPCQIDRNSEQFAHQTVPAFDCRTVTEGTSVIRSAGYQVYRKGVLILDTSASQTIHFEDTASAYKIELVGSKVKPAILVTHLESKKQSQIAVSGVNVTNIYINFADKNVDIRDMEVREGDTTYVLYSGLTPYTGIAIKHDYKLILELSDLKNGGYTNQGIVFHQ